MNVLNFKYLKHVFMFVFAGVFLLAFLPAGAQQNLTIKGKVLDSDGNPLEGTAVVVKGTSTGAGTNSDGDYVLQNVPRDCVLEFIIVGYVTQEIKVTGEKTVINVIMLEEEAESLEEVTVVAFGKQKKSSVIASIESVKLGELKQPASNLTGAFAGKIPGIISYQTTGEPGADNAQFFVRGVTTFGYKSSPLILVDGFEASNDDLARMQPDDIESFSILKDASATVLYGARGANGIILVSTKSGREGPVKVNFRFDTHVATPTQIPEMMDGVEYMKLYNSVLTSRNPSLGAYYSQQKILSTARGENPMVYPDIDWYSSLMNTYTVNTKANLNISGGGKVANYYVAGGYDKETGLLKVDKRNNFNNNIDINRFHMRTNVIFKLTSTTTLDTRIQGRFESYTGPYRSASDIFKLVMNSNPVDFPLYYTPDAANTDTSHILFGGSYLNSGGIKMNPYAEMVKGYENRNESTVTVQATLLQNLDFITEGLKFQIKVSENVWSKYSTKRTYNPYIYSIRTYDQIRDEYKLFNLNPTRAQAYLGGAESGRDATGHFYTEARFNWNRKFGKHSVGAMTVGVLEEILLTGGNSNSIFETLPERNLGNSSRLTYDFDERYFLEFSYGYNGSEKFAGNKRFGFFPSLGAGWIASNEEFWKSLKNVVSKAKLKFTWGLVGNDAIAGRAGRFFFLSDLSQGGGNYTWGESFRTFFPGYSFNRYANPEIGWEVSEKYNLGFEIGLLKNEALNLQIDIYRDYRSKIYMQRQFFPSTAGLEAAVSSNIGEVESKGIDASVDYQHSFSKDFWVTGRANLTYAVNKYVELDEKDFPYDYLKRRGHNINQMWGLVAERLFVDDKETQNMPRQEFGSYTRGDIKYKDINGDGRIDDNDRIPMGYPSVPEIQYGFGLSVGFKKFDFSFFFQGNARVSFFIDASYDTGDDGFPKGIAPFVDRRNAMTVVAKNAWTEDNPNVNAFWPRMSVEAMSNNTQASTWWLRDGSFLRLKSLEAGYNFSGIDKIGLVGGRIYFSAENLFVLSPFKLWDPEMGSNGLKYPINKRFNIGVQLSF